MRSLLKVVESGGGGDDINGTWESSNGVDVMH